MKTWTTRNGYRITRVLSGRSNVFLLRAARYRVLVDTGPRFMRGRLLNNLEGMGLKRIDDLVVTHAHFDHAANATAIRERYGAKVIIHRREATNLESGENVRVEGLGGFTRLLLKGGNRLPRRLGFDPCKPDVLADLRYDFPGAGIDAYLTPTPGHTPGSMSLIVDHEIAIVGDAMFGILPWSVFPPFGSDADQLVESWEGLLDAGCRLFLPAHGSAHRREPVERDFERRSARARKA